MTPECLQCYQEVVDQLFIRWDALKLAVEHMGGKHGHQTAIDIKTYVYNYCTQNDNIHPTEIIDILNEVIDEEFDTICEDNSANELGTLLVEYLKLCLDGRFDEVRQRLSQLPKCVNWLDPGFKMTLAPKADDDSDSMSDSDDDEDEDMELGDDDEEKNQRNAPQVDEDGFTLVSSRRRR